MSKLGFLLIYHLRFALYVARTLTCCDNAAIGTTYCQPGTHLLMLLEGVARRLDQGELCSALLCFCVCSGSRMVVALMLSSADLHCSRVRRGAAPSVSYVSALLVRVRVCECACARRCQLFVRVCLWVSPCSCVRVHASWHLGQRGRGGRAQRGIASYEC